MTQLQGAETRLISDVGFTNEDALLIFVELKRLRAIEKAAKDVVISFGTKNGVWCRNNKCLRKLSALYPVQPEGRP